MDSGDAANDGPDSGGMIDMFTLMDTLQTLGVDVVRANRFVASVLKARPTIVELYGRGSICRHANGSHRNLNIDGIDALDLRTCKPCGKAWDFTQTADRQEALQLVQDRRHTWVIGSPPMHCL